MDDLMITASSLIAQETRRIEASAHNVANAATPGFKSEVAFQDILGSQAGALGAGRMQPLRGVQVSTDFTGGKLMHTGSPFDMAINGDGFFAIGTPSGIAYTRAGSFRRDDQGRLVTTQGWPLQAAGGGDVIVSNKAWHVEPDGTIVDDGSPTMTIGVTRFAEPKQLTRDADGLFLANDAAPLDNGDAKITQGYLEASNVVVGNDMVQVMDAMRRVESGQKLVQAYDDMVGNVLQRLGDM